MCFLSEMNSRLCELIRSVTFYLERHNQQESNAKSYLNLEQNTIILLIIKNMFLHIICCKHWAIFPANPTYLKKGRMSEVPVKYHESTQATTQTNTMVVPLKEMFDWFVERLSHKHACSVAATLHFTFTQFHAFALGRCKVQPLSTVVYWATALFKQWRHLWL